MAERLVITTLIAGIAEVDGKTEQVSLNSEHALPAQCSKSRATKLTVHPLNLLYLNTNPSMHQFSLRSSKFGSDYV